MGLRQETFSAIRWTTFSTAASLLLRLMSIGVLARLLEPEDYGLMAMVGVVLGLARLFTDLGMNSAFVQRQGVTQEQRSSLYWLNISMSGSLALLVVLLSPILAQFFGDQRLTPLMMLSSSTFVLAALGQQVKMSAEKELKFGKVVIIGIVADVSGFVTAVIAALAGWGVYSLVFGGIVGTSSGTLMYWLFVANGWRPLWRLQLADIRPFLGFGSATVGNDLVNYCNRTIDIFLGGRLLAATQLGLYSVPRNLVLQLGGMVNSIITRVGFPLISLVQTDVKKVRSIYLQTMNMTAATNAPVYVGIAFFASEIVAIILGSGWERSGELLGILALWGGLRTTGNPIGSLARGVGRPELELKWNLVLLVVIPASVWIGSRNGPEGMAWALLCLQIVLFVPCWFFLVRPLCEAKLLEYSVAALRPFVLAVLSISPGFLLATQFDGSLLRLVVGILVSAPLYLALSYFANRQWVVAMMELAGRPLAEGQD